MPQIRPIFLLLALATVVEVALADPVVVIRVPEQRLALVENGLPVAQYSISTSKFGIGDQPRSYATPLGTMEVAAKAGDHAPLGMVFKGRWPTGEIIRPNAPGRDPIVTRILHLRGLDRCNAGAFSRGIYFTAPPKSERSANRRATVAFA
jgi:hypothetical protein